MSPGKCKAHESNLSGRKKAQVRLLREMIPEGSH